MQSMVEKIYLCKFCGEKHIACALEYDFSSPRGEQCEKCSSNEFVCLSDVETYDKFESIKAGNGEKLIKFKFKKLIPIWEQHNKNLNPTSGKLPTPKCPTCGYENVRRISDGEKLGNAVMLGYLGNKRKMQFECLNPNCRYRW
ncbi:MAG: hypothetical protein RSE64_05405 [Oscillospiraceae bacterium]